MKKHFSFLFVICFVILSFLIDSECYAQRVSVKGYYRKDGTYVRPHTRSYPRSGGFGGYGTSSGKLSYSTPRLPVPYSTSEYKFVKGYYKADGTYVRGHMQRKSAASSSNDNTDSSRPKSFSASGSQNNRYINSNNSPLTDSRFQTESLSPNEYDDFVESKTEASAQDTDKETSSIGPISFRPTVDVAVNSYKPMSDEARAREKLRHGKGSLKKGLFTQSRKDLERAIQLAPENSWITEEAQSSLLELRKTVSTLVPGYDF